MNGFKSKNRKVLETVLLYGVLLCAGYFIADLAIIKYRVALLPQQVAPSKPPVFIGNSLVPRSSYGPITSRNIFSLDGLIPNPLGAGGKDNKEKDAAPVLSQLPLTLAGTIVMANPERSIANIDLKGKNQVIPYGVGRQIDRLATLVKVERNKVIIRNANNGRLEFIENKDVSKIAFSTAKPAGELAPKSPSDIQQVAQNKFEIKRSDLMKYTSDLNSILLQASMLPQRNAAGEIECFKFTSIQPGSVYTQLGFQQADCISEVNGEKIDSPAKAMELYRNLQNSPAIKIKYSRDGKETESEYSIK